MMAKHRSIRTLPATKIGMANLVYNMKRLVWLNARGAPG